MNIWHFVLREIRHRKLSALLTAVSVGVATACLSGALVLLKADAASTEKALAAKQQAVEAAGADLEDAMRKIMKGLGFNVVILPKDQDLQEMHLTGMINKTMPEEYVDRLANSNIVTVNHLLPTVTKKLNWPEQNDLPIVLYGTRGEVPIAHRDPKKPLLDAVPRGSMIVGYQVGQKLSLTESSEVTLLGKPFKILKAHGERGSIDDSTVWINLGEAQEMLGMENLIHAIQALECHCAGDRISQIREEIISILPGTQAIERGAPALARAEARNQAKVSAQQSLDDEIESRGELRGQRERFASLLVPLATLGSALLMGLTTLANVRQRRQEIAILGALGLRSRQVLCVFLGKALLVGIVGAVVGLIAGALIGGALSGSGGGVGISGPTIAMSFGLAIGVALLGSWLPALSASRQDAATVLQED
jgi:putative ABC transport system permease protein